MEAILELLISTTNANEVGRVASQNAIVCEEICPLAALMIVAHKLLSERGRLQITSRLFENTSHLFGGAYDGIISQALSLGPWLTEQDDIEQRRLFLTKVQLVQLHGFIAWNGTMTQVRNCFFIDCTRALHVIIGLLFEFLILFVLEDSISALPNQIKDGSLMSQ